MNNKHNLTNKIVTPAISVTQQVQFILATMILVGIILGNSFSQWFFMLDVLAGCNLLVASLTGACPLAKLMAKLPWNKSLLIKE